MLIVDIVVVLVLIAALFGGLLRGLVATAGTLVGIVLGAVVAVWLTPVIAPTFSGWEYRSLVLGLIALAIVVILASIGTAVGRRLRRGVDRARLAPLDRVLGGVVNTAAAAIVLLLASGAIVGSGMPGVAPAVASSRVLGVIDALTPPQMDSALAEFRGFIVDEGIPRVGELLAPEVEPTAPPVSLDDPQLQDAAASVARISGNAYACGASLTGSGFVAAEDLVVTNAHVVAGVDEPLVELPGRDAAEGRIVYFDPVDDLAVISVPGLAADPLPIVDPVEAGTPVAVQGYPLGGPFTSGAAYVLSVGSAVVADIYDDGAQPREIYALEANVRPGNSGGPLLTEAGEVTGVVFARGEDDDTRGYAMTTTELRPALEVSPDAETVSSGACTG
ncbi:MarP family serine protease [Microbacterium sp. EYE_5]|uniref:MarP family serine protease n=1 Tax=unclassified Microbacterium TaxID=2609290 RepID=UPI002006CCAB|nr:MULTISPECIES: MarP family serine protease [unclassified Microbacterium]MCK6081062.1 MarP family serine protease [Microbacterium sp. EYE_382]MCK6086332.1 MarP family serine protease [Microbacterium sp. EYE_384]MCK6124170.1 MarP family serine protease [Microbacterium sp. EYE_80]MCK6127079.1 MarP family serine protease [Microbacterium sp. EYE_79]MCK6142017.1 MarP family serine protease [Microbacterium sp. EYE_39]